MKNNEVILGFCVLFGVILALPAIITKLPIICVSAISGSLCFCVAMDMDPDYGDGAKLTLGILFTTLPMLVVSYLC